MADINNNDIWIDVETLAKLKNITRRAVRLALNQNKYEYKVENIRGGKTYKIKLSTLEEELQLKYFQEYFDDYKTCENEVIELSNLNIKQEKLISENQRKIALAKYDLIYAWLDLRKEYKRDKLKTNGNIPDKEFLRLYNTGMFQEEICKILGKVSIGSLYRWRALLDYNKDWTALVGQYKYSTRKEYRTTLNEEQVKIFIQILLSPSAFSIGKAISLTKHILKERGQEILPKDITFRRYAEWFRDNNFDKWTLARDGEKALKDKVSPFIVRNAALLKPGQVLVASDRGKEFIYRYLKLFKLTEGMNSRELRSFLEIIPLKNPKLKVSYSAFHSKRKKYQTEGMMGIFPKYFIPDYREEEPKVRRNLNRLPKVYDLATTEQIEIIYKCFCFGIPASQTAKIANMGNTTTETFYQFIRAKIYDKQYQELVEHFDSDPQIPQVRIFMNDVSICLYCYNDKVFITHKPLKAKLPQRRQQPYEVKEARRMYNILYRKKFMASMRKYLDHHLSVFLWKELNPNFEDQLNLIYEMIHI